MEKISTIFLLMMMFASNSFGAGALMPPPKAVFSDSAGHPCSGCRVCSFTEGTTTAKATYSNEDLTTQNANPVVLDSRGEATIFLDGKYKIRLQNRNQTSCTTGTSIWTVDNVSAVSADGVDLSLSEWMETGSSAFIYIAATQFSTSGDNTGTFIVGRRVWATSSGERYGRITASSYASGITTVTVAWDSGTLDSGGITDMKVSVVTPTNDSLSWDMISSGTGTVTISGALTIPASISTSGTNTHSGAQNISGVVTASGGLASSSTTTISGGGNITGNYAGSHTLSGVVTASGGLVSSSTTTISGNITSSSPNTFSGSQVISGSINSSATNTWSNTQTVTGNINSSGTNTFSGQTSIEGAMITSTPTGTAIPISSADGTLASGWIPGYVSGLISAETSSSLSGATSSIDVGTVTAGDKIFVTASALVSIPSGTPIEWALFGASKDSGSATIEFAHDHTEMYQLIQGNELEGYVEIPFTISAILKVAGSGTLVLKASASGSAGITITETQIYALFLKKQ